MATVFQAEIFAIGQSAHHLITHPEMLREITAVDIITDSKAALMAVDCITTASKIVMDCMNALDKLGSLITVRLHWTKAHVGYEGNKKADQLAKEGTTKINYMAEPLLPVPKSWIRQKIQQTLLQEWTTRWLGNGEARQTKLFIPKPNAKLTKKLLTCITRKPALEFLDGSVAIVFIDTITTSLTPYHLMTLLAELARLKEKKHSTFLPNARHWLL
jgi:hypothetical protein